MRRSALTLALVLVGGLTLSTAVAQADGTSKQVAIQAQSLDRQPESRIEGDEAMDGAVAAAVIGAVARQFGEREVGVKLDSVAVMPASVRDRDVSGSGRLRIGDDEAWIPFRFTALYDTSATSVSQPYLVIGDTAGGEPIANDSKLALALSDRVGSSLRDEFAQQPVRLLMDQVTTNAAGSRYLRVQGIGTADFGREGATTAQIEALYDRRSGQWLRVDYELGTTANWDEVSTRPLASR
ncbi:hypothetical protein ACFQZQ_02290 [Lysobacter koreensis]|uniref:Outer membrane lipoprotein-sorting protein n=1 Tax=Lysobacter koreensis TaxID=266122 RepID=A0ABW2YI82_9GAMM